MKFLMGLLAALFMVGTAQAGLQGQRNLKSVVQDKDDTKAYFWNVKDGSSSTYTMVFTTEAGEVPGPELTITVKANGNLRVFSQLAAGHQSDYVGGESGGYFCWGSMEDGKFKPVMALFKLGAKAGDTWDGWAGGKKEEQPEVVVKYVGNEELKTAAGVLKDVIHVQATVTDGPVMDMYFAPGKGLVKSVLSFDGKERRRFELSAFTEGK